MYFGQDIVRMRGLRRWGKDRKAKTNSCQLLCSCAPDTTPPASMAFTIPPNPTLVYTPPPPPSAIVPIPVSPDLLHSLLHMDTAQMTHSEGWELLLKGSHLAINLTKSAVSVSPFHQDRNLTFQNDKHTKKAFTLQPELIHWGVKR